MKKNLFSRVVLRVLTVLAGAVAGIVMGFYTVLAIVVAKARAGYYVFGLEEILAVNVETVVFVLLVAAGAFLAYRMPARLLRAVVRGLAALVAGLLMGALFGYLLFGTTEWAWAGALILSAFLLLGVTALVLSRSRRRRLSYADLGIASVVGVAFLVIFLIGFQEPEAVAIPETEPAPVPPPLAVDEVVFIVGDAGATEATRTPLLEALRYDVEHWSATLARDSAVSVVYAGDLVYPVGVRDRDHPAFPQDSSRLWNQVELVGGPEARRHRTLGLFVPGNHDWGNTGGDVGIQHLINLSEQLGLARASGHAVDLFPKAGQPGPIVRDVRANIRFVLLDTHWFLRERSRGVRSAFLARLQEALDTAGDRHVIIVTHHPFQSAGPHGGVVPGYHSWGVEYVLRQTGAIVQDLNAPIYEELLDGMRAIFAGARRPPLVFAGGHDHSLQVIERQQESDPAYMLVSGAGSKLSPIRTVPGMLYGAARPGYMMLLFRKDAAVDLFVIAGDPALQRCTDEVGAALERCMTLGENAFDIVYSKTLAEAPPASVRSDTLHADTQEEGQRN